MFEVGGVQMWKETGGCCCNITGLLVWRRAESADCHCLCPLSDLKTTVLQVPCGTACLPICCLPQGSSGPPDCGCCSSAFGWPAAGQPHLINSDSHLLARRKALIVIASSLGTSQLQNTAPKHSVRPTEGVKVAAIFDFSHTTAHYHHF